MPQLARWGEWAVWTVWAAVFLVATGWVILCGVGGASGNSRPWSLRLPRVAQFLSARTAWRPLTGLPLTLMLWIAAYFLIVYMTGLVGPGAQDWVVRLDQQVATGLSVRRTPWLTGFFGVVTAFGYWVVIATLAVSTSILLWLRERLHGVAGLWIALLGNQVTVSVLKALFVRDRPGLAVFREDSYSFPSGHGAVSAAFFGFLAWVVIRERIVPSWLALLVSGAVIVLIGFSRMYLGEHYLSDVLSGNLVGFFWAFVGIWCLERFAQSQDAPPSTLWRRTVQVVVVIVTAGVLWVVVADYQRALTAAAPAMANVVL